LKLVANLEGDTGLAEAVGGYVWKMCMNGDV